MSHAFDRLRSRLVPLLTPNVDTDQVIPARYLKGTDKAGLGAGLFAGWRYDADGRPRPDFPLNQARFAGARVLVAGDNFGCGSSREHAAWALVDHGFRAVVSPRCADIFRANALKNGLLPVELPAAVCADLAALAERDPACEIVIDLEAQHVTLPGGQDVPFAIDPFARRCLLQGVDHLGFLLAEAAAIAAYEARGAYPLDTRRAPAASLPDEAVP